jgi:sulfite exporter TauE/SafE
LAALSFDLLIYWEVSPNLIFFAAMQAIKANVKKQLIQLAKWAVVVVAFYFIYIQLHTSKALDWTKLETVIRQHSSGYILFILSLSFWNSYFEILKWQNLLQSF